MFGSILSRIRSNAVLLLVGLICIGWPASSAWAQACPDADSDGYYDCLVPGCDDTGLLCGDCDDANGAAYPTQPELCNHFDDNCDGRVDEGFSQPVTARSVADTMDGAPNDNLGFAVAAIGDVDNDGLDDFAVGVHLDDAAGGDSGSVLVYSGVDQSIHCRAVDPAGAGSDWLGYSVAGIGDVTGDGTPDFAAGAPYDDTSEGSNAGSVLIFSGDDCAFVRKMFDASGAANDYLGSSVAGVGEVSGDSTPDLVAGAPYGNTAAGNDAGRALVFSGADGSLVHRLEDPNGAASYRMGTSVAAVGIIDGDTVPDIAAGAPGDNDLANSAGSVVLFSGASGSDIRKLTDGSSTDALGTSVAGIDDVNNDGVDDVLAGAPFEDSQNPNAGAVVLFSGTDGSVLRLLTDPVGNSSDYLGWSVTVMNSLTDDGIQEVVVGVQRDDDAATDGGSVVIFDPTNGNVVRKLTDPEAGTSDWLGNSVAAVSDLSGDGAPEILAGAHLAQSLEETDVGKVVVFSFEADCDGDGVSPFGTDCDDTAAANFSGNTETCDGVDNDCDGAVDEDDDGDGADKCADCDDANPLVYPGASERCNGVDDDCDTFVDNGPDADSDGVEAPCDCEDGNSAIYPGAAEVCNYADEDCALVDEGFNHPLAIQTVADTVDGAPSDYFGFAVAGIGDVNADGLDDFAVGVYADDESLGDSGSVLVYSGADLSIICRAVDPAAGSSDWLGYSVVGLGDVTGDGTPDFAAGAVYDDTSEGTNAGSVVIFSGDDCTFVRKLIDQDGTANAYLGLSVAAMPDITGDGRSEVVAGANGDDTARGNDAGTVLVFNGATGARIFRSFDPNGRASDQLGFSVSGLGDVNYDNVADFAGGARYDNNALGNNAGSILIFSGADGSVIRELQAGSASDQVGHAIARIEDIDGDGVDDIVAGVPFEDSENSNAGAVMLFSGADGSLIRLMTDPVGESSDYLGWAVALMDDITGDGIQEVIAGVQQDDDAATNGGSVVIFDPANGNVVQKLTDPDATATDWLGTSVAAVADLSGDGAPEILAGAYLAQSREETDVGKVLIFSFETDCDGDGVSPFGTDCDDSAAANYSGNTETCDGVDNDCDGAVDEDDDGDGSDKCADCDDANPLVYPGASERCNGVDDDCDTFVDNGPDADSDGVEAPCDCEDGNSAIYPGAAEVCNYADEDCALVDEGFNHPLAIQTVADTVDGAPSDYFGFAVAGIGDVNADGLDDFAVGVYLDDEAGLFDSGSVLVYSGADLSIVCRAVDPAGGSSDWLGYSVVGLGDVTGDGTPDFAAGSVYDDTSEGTNAGSVVIFSGDDCAFVRKLVDPDGTANAYLGLSVAAMPDITGDGRSEVVAGANGDDTARGNDAGTVLVFNGATGARIFRSFDPNGRASDQLGFSVSGLGDVNYDNVADFAGGARYDNNALGNNAGSILIFSGADGSVIRELQAGSASDQVGHAIARIEDIDGDGVDDIVAGVPFEDSENSNAGAVMLFSGADGSLIRLMTDPVGESSDYLGWAVALMDDITGDGIQEVIAGVQRDDDAATDGGSVVIFDPTNGNVVQKLTDPDATATDYMGSAVAAVADLSGDGAPEILAGAYLAQSREEADVGKVLIFSFETDCDGDGVSPFGTDCDDTAASNYSGNTENCDGVDNDCDGAVDEDDDGDGSDKCLDCDDANPLIYPGASEVCNGVDDDCDTFVDNGADADSDGSEAPCDCDDDNASINPGGAEICNRRDDDCDGTVDEGFTGAISFIKLVNPDPVANDYLGQSATGIGDVDDDGVVDFAVGIYADDEGGPDSGSVLVYSGGDRSVICRAVDPGGSNSDWLGYSVVGIGDVTADGTPDFAAGAPNDDTSEGTNAGSVVIFSGDDCAFVRRLVDADGTGNAYLGTAVAAMPDITGDGVSEVVAGAYGDDTARGNDAGTVLVFNGASGTRILKSFDPNGRASDQLGWSVTGLGDVNYDNVADFAAGARYDNNLFGNSAGSILVFSGADGAVIRELREGSGSDQVGHAIARIEDVDGDGVDDVVAGVPFEDTENSNAGAVMLFSGADGSLIRLMTDPVGQGSDYLGWSVTATGDITGDGIQEVVAGVQRDDDTASNAGSVVVFDPTNGNVVQKLTDLDGAANDWFGTWVASIGDIRDGGVAEFLATSPLDESGAVLDVGSLVLFSYDEYDCDSDGQTPLNGDCNDASDAVPGPEICDGLDNDCNGEVDEGFDQDSDGVVSCFGDCDDSDPNNWDSCATCGDQDSDGWYDLCDAYVTFNGPDCDDAVPTCTDDCSDNNGNMTPDCAEVCPDVDGDDYAVCDGFCTLQGGDQCGDCDDDNAASYPGAAELCDGEDNDCLNGVPANEADADSDGVRICDGDCDDTVATCTDDCTTDLDSDATPDCADDCIDGDADGYGSAGGAGDSCSGTDCNDADPNNWSSCASCVDTDSDTYFVGCDLYSTINGPDCDDAVPSCTDDCTDADSDGLDACAGDCDDTVPTCTDDCVTDLDSDATPDCADDCIDGDADGYGSAGGAGDTCSGADCNDADPNNWTSCASCVDTDSDTYFVGCDLYSTINGPDCDDAIPSCTDDCSDGNSNGTADCAEVCPDVDNDDYAVCDGFCTPQAGDQCGDCDDTNPNSYPGAQEICDGEDNDCQNGVPANEADADSDGVRVCDNDCDDTVATCTDDCTTDLDSDATPDCADDCIDGDADGYGSAGGAGDSCSGTDCNDADPNNWSSCASCVDTDSDTYFVGCDLYSTINGPDCDDAVPSCTDDCTDADSDGLDACAGDCDDTVPTCTDDCVTDLDSDATADCADDCIDGDADGYGSAGGAGDSCSGTDCNDADPNNWDSCASCVDTDSDTYFVGCDLYSTINGPDCDDAIPSCTDDCSDGNNNGTADCAEVCPDVDNDDYAVCDGFCSLQAGDQCGDCDDTNPNSYPGAPEICDGEDNDCQNGVPANEADADSDGVRVCDNDCDDTVATCTDDCVTDLDSDATPDCADDCIDGDADGYGSAGGAGDSCSGTDCNDADPNNWSSCASCVDTDSDTYFVGCDLYSTINGPDCDDAVPSCTDDCTDADSDGLDACAGDCDDTVPTCTDDCVTDLDSDATADCADDCIDRDGDDYGSAGGAGDSCSGTDCNDADPNNWSSCASCVDSDSDTYFVGCDLYSTINGPDCDDAIPSCTDDCSDGNSNGTADCAEVCPDVDGDDYAVCDGFCSLQAGDQCGDCDDGDASRYPGNEEVCDGVDNDCNGSVPTDEADADSDGYRICENDCDDGNASRYPGNEEVCDGVDNDCDDQVPANEADADSDGFRICEGDCDDANTTVYPGAEELCDGIDNDCDGSVPAGEANVDGDGFRICDGDCNDANATVYPGAAELCDGIDNDCDGSVPEGEVDGDEDGYRVCDGDCNDDNDAINPGAAEICDDGIDNDCDGNTDLDDFDDCGSSRTICSTLGDQPSGQEVDEDIYMFTGTQGEEVDVLAIATNGFGRANLILVDAMSGGGSVLQEIDRGRFPNRITVTLPATGDYFIAVSEQPEVALLSGRRFTGDYCVTLDATMGGSVSMQATDSVEPGDPVASEQPDIQPGRVPTAMREPRVGAKKRGR